MAMALFQFPFNAMGTPCDLQLFANSHAQAKKVADAAIADVGRLEKRYSRYREDSFLSKINRVAGVGGSINVDVETAKLLDYAATCHQQSDGLFDITSGVLRRLWRFDSGQLPDEQQLHALLAQIGWHKLRWQAPRLTFLQAGMELDFGGIVKEYAVDRVAGLCKAAGIHHGVVNLGGDINIIGPRPDGEAWRIGIRHPRQPQALLTTVALRHGAMASSGDYERCLIIDGIRYGHVFNPKTGWPVKQLAAVSVVGDFCVVAGSAATIAMLMEMQGPSWLASLGLQHLWVDVQGNIGGQLAD